MATMSATEAAEALNISREAVGKAIRQGKIKVIPNKKPVRVSAEEVERYRGKTITRSLEECSTLVQRELVCRTLMQHDDGRLSLVRVYGALTDDQQLSDCIVIIGDQYDRAGISDQELPQLFSQFVTHLQTNAVARYSFAGSHSATFAGREPEQWYSAAQSYDWLSACWCVADSGYVSTLALEQLSAESIDDHEWLAVKLFSGSMSTVDELDDYIVGGFTTYPKPSYDFESTVEEDKQLREIIRKDQSDHESVWIVDPLHVSKASGHLMKVRQVVYEFFHDVGPRNAEYFVKVASIAVHIAEKDMRSRTTLDLPSELRSGRLCVNVKWWCPDRVATVSDEDLELLHSRAANALWIAEAILKPEVDKFSSNYRPAMLNAIDSLAEIIRHYSNESAPQLPRKLREKDMRIIDVSADESDELMNRWIESLSPVEENLNGNDLHARRVRKMIAERGAYNVPILEDEHGALAYTINDEESWFVLPVADLELIDGFSRDNAVVHVRRSSTEALLLVEFGDGELTPLPTVSPFGRSVGYKSGAEQSAIDIVAAKYALDGIPDRSEELDDITTTLSNKDFVSLSFSLNGGE